MKRFFASLAIAAVMAAAPSAALAKGPNKDGGNFCPGRDNECPSTITINGDDDGDGTIEIGESYCNNKSDGTYLVNLQTVVCIGGVIVDVL